MAHDLLIKDNKAAMMYVGQTPWHGLGTFLETPPVNAQEAIQAAGLDWKVRMIPLFASDTRHYYQVPGRYAVVPEPEWGKPECPIFGEVEENYAPLQNVEAFEFFDPLIVGKKATYETAGALGKGEKVWVLAKIKKSIHVVEDDEILPYVLLVNGHDGRTAVRVILTPIRVVCTNTLSLALNQATNMARIYHQPGMRRRLKRAFADADSILQAYDELAKKFQAMIGRTVDLKLLNRYLMHVFPDPKAPAAGKKTEERFVRELEKVRQNRSGARDLFESGKGNQTEKVKNTLWAAYNGVVEYIDHKLPYPDPLARFNNLLFSDGFQIKTHALELAAELAATDPEQWKN